MDKSDECAKRIRMNRAGSHVVPSTFIEEIQMEQLVGGVIFNGRYQI